MSKSKIHSTEIMPPLPSTLSNVDMPATRAFLEKVHSMEHVVILSPHLDDAVLSMGSLTSYFLKKDVPVDVITIFTEGTDLASTATKTLLRNAGFTDTAKYFTARRDEDKIALAELGPVRAHHLGYIDSAWRSDEYGVPFYNDSQLADIAPKESTLHEKLLARLKTHVELRKNTGIFAPLARGNHVDHQLVRNTARELYSRTIFYEDFPYSTYHKNQDGFIESNNLTSIEWKGEYGLKMNAIQKYMTQQYSLFYKGPIHLPFEKLYISRR